MKVRALWLGTAVAAALVMAPMVHGAEVNRPAARSTDAIPYFDAPAAELRVALDMTLAEHAFLLGEAMRAGLTTADDFDAVGAALEANTADLVHLVADVYGDEAGQAFGDLWRSHVAYLIDYTRALAEDDDEARQIAEEQLHHYVQDFSAFLASANPNLPEAAVDELVGEHVQQLEAVAALDEGDYGQAYPALHRTYEHMFVIGDAIARAVAKQFPQRYSGSEMAFSPAGDLRIALNRLLGEHSTLAVTTMRSSLTDGADQSAAAEALDANTDALAAWVADVYGQRASDAFRDLWATHTDAYIAYVEATVSGDESGRERALAALRTYQSDFGAFMAGANPYLSEGRLRQLLEHHTDQLVDQADAFAAGDYEEAYRISRETIRHGMHMADVLAAAVVEQFPARFLPDAAMPGTPSGGVPLPWLLAAIPLGGLMVLLFLRVRRARSAV